MQKGFSLFFSAVFLILIFSLYLSAQEDYLYENISVADGLSSSSFNPFENIYQDKFGFLWFGTTDGLNRYDGYEFKVYKNIPGDTTTLPSSNIQTVTEDADGNLWIGTPGVMNRFDRQSETFSHFPIEHGSATLQQDIQIAHTLIDTKKNFWIGTQGRSVQKWNKEKQKWDLIPMMMEVEGVDTLVETELAGALGITQLRNGNILVSSFTAGIYYYNEASNKFEPFNFAGNEIPVGIVEIFEDRGGTIWLGGRNVLIEYNPKSFTLEYKTDLNRFLSSSNDSFFFNINERKDGTFLLCSIPNGIIKFDPGTEKFEFLDLGKEFKERGIGQYAVTKFVDKFGVYWIGLGDNGIIKFDPNRKPFRYHTYDKVNSGQSTRAISTDLKINSFNPAELIASTDRGGFYRFNIKDKNYDQLSIPLPEIYTDSSNVYNFAIDDNNNVWFSSSIHKISSYSLVTGKTESFKVIDRDMRTAGAEVIRSIEYMPKNKLILSTSVGGFIFDTITKELKNLPSTMNRRYGDEFISEIKNVIANSESEVNLTEVGEAANLEQKFSVSEATDFLVVCLGEGNHPQGMFDYGGIKTTDGNDIWSMNEIKKTFHDGGGYKNRLSIDVITISPGEYSAFYSTDVGHSYNNFNVKPPENPAWYGIRLIELNGELTSQLKRKVEIEKNKNDFPDYFEVTFTLGSRKYPSDIWIGANEKGIIRYDVSTNKFSHHYLDVHTASIFSTTKIFEDSQGRLWITIYPSGFYRFIPETNQFISNSSIPDLPITGINGIIEDFEGNIWVSSSGGITKLTEHDDGSWSTSNYDSKDGVPGGFGGGAAITRDGEIFFGSFNGLTAFFPSTENTSPPIPIISNITISDVSLFDKTSQLKLDDSIYELDELNLSYAQNDVSFDFASLHYSRPSKNRVSYRLEGFNDHWIFTDKNFASFTNLEPGEYTLRIKALSGFGVPGIEERTLAITIAPPWYRTTAAYISYVFLFIALVFGIDRLQRKRILRQEREKQKIQEAELRAVAAEAQARAVQAENDRKSKELEEARQLQLSMLPKKLPQLPHLDIAVYMKTATEVGGDYYDFHVGMDGTLTVVVGDATGHGMKAGTMVTAAKSLFSTHAANPDILFTFSEISRCIKHMDMHLLTMCMTVMKIKQNKMIMSTAGMPPTLIFRNQTKQLEEIVLKGMPLGAVDSFPYAIKETELNTGDTLLIMSDGYPELFNSEKELYGYERVQNDFHKVAEKSPEQIIERLKMNAFEWTGEAEPDDDITFVVIKVK
ncbi:MAG: SpoIIE family protein phosphatase [Melioribacteraceae bacterium]|nr:SpoIIE family protein phosphatase [Melioribacteraceae bacterium]